MKYAKMPEPDAEESDHSSFGGSDLSSDESDETDSEAEEKKNDQIRKLREQLKLIQQQIDTLMQQGSKRRKKRKRKMSRREKRDKSDIKKEPYDHLTGVPSSSLGASFDFIDAHGSGECFIELLSDLSLLTFLSIQISSNEQYYQLGQRCWQATKGPGCAIGWWCGRRLGYEGLAKGKRWWWWRRRRRQVANVSGTRTGAAFLRLGGGGQRQADVV